MSDKQTTGLINAVLSAAEKEISRTNDLGLILAIKEDAYDELKKIMAENRKEKVNRNDK